MTMMAGRFLFAPEAAKPLLVSHRTAGMLS